MVTLEDPVSYRLVYTGLTGLIFDEYVKVLINKWQDDLSVHNTFGIMDYAAIKMQRLLATNMELDYRAARYADKRYRWWHYSSSLGKPPVYTTGPSSDVVNIGPFRLDRKFRFKLTQYKVNITEKWRFKFKPSVSFTTELPLVDRISAGFEFSYKKRGDTIFKFFLGVAVKVATAIERSSGEISVSVELPLWGNGHGTKRTDYPVPQQQYAEREWIPRIISRQLSESWLCCIGQIEPHHHGSE